MSTTSFDLQSLLQGPSYYEQRSSMPDAPPAKDAVSPVASRFFTRLRKKELDARGVSGSPLKNAKQIPFGQDPISQRVIAEKINRDVTVGRNTALVVFRSPNSREHHYVIASTEGPPGGAHAELRALDSLPAHVRENKENIEIVYTERKPCRHGSDCSRKLKLGLGPETQVLFSADHTPDPKRRREAEENHREAQAKHDVRRPGVRRKILS